MLGHRYVTQTPPSWPPWSVRPWLACHQTLQEARGAAFSGSADRDRDRGVSREALDGPPGACEGLVVPPYGKRGRSKFGEGTASQGRGPQVTIGDAVVESYGRRAPRETPIRDSVTGLPISWPGARREMGPSSPAKVVVRIGEAYDVQEGSDSLREAERRRYGAGGYKRRR